MCHWSALRGSSGHIAFAATWGVYKKQQPCTQKRNWSVIYYWSAQMGWHRTQRAKEAAQMPPHHQCRSKEMKYSTDATLFTVHDRNGGSSAVLIHLFSALWLRLVHLPQWFVFRRKTLQLAVQILPANCSHRLCGGHRCPPGWWKQPSSLDHQVNTHSDCFFPCKMRVVLPNHDVNVRKGLKCKKKLNCWGVFSIPHQKKLTNVNK